MLADGDIEGRHRPRQPGMLHLPMARQPLQMGTMPLFELLKGGRLRSSRSRLALAAAQPRIGREAVAVPKREGGVIPDKGGETPLRWPWSRPWAGSRR